MLSLPVRISPLRAHSNYDVVCVHKACTQNVRNDIKLHVCFALDILSVGLFALVDITVLKNLPYKPGLVCMKTYENLKQGLGVNVGLTRRLIILARVLIFAINRRLAFGQNLSAILGLCRRYRRCQKIPKYFSK